MACGPCHEALTYNTAPLFPPQQTLANQQGLKRKCLLSAAIGFCSLVWAKGMVLTMDWLCLRNQPISLSHTPCIMQRTCVCVCVCVCVCLSVCLSTAIFVHTVYIQGELFSAIRCIYSYVTSSQAILSCRHSVFYGLNALFTMLQAKFN